MDRRRFLQTAAACTAGLGLAGRAHAADENFPPTRVITHGPKHHWFGYYDKLQFDPTDRGVLSMEVDFEHRPPRPDDVIKIGLVDLGNDDRWFEIGKSTAWGWQQGCMLQWVPGRESTVLWNDREDDHYVCRMVDIKSGDERTIDSPIYTLSPDGHTAVTADFRRINDVRPGYGYVGLPDPYADDLAPQDSGVWRVDLDTGQSDLIVSIAEIAKLGEIPRNRPGVKHYFNHLLFNPDGSRFIFLHRWRYPNGSRLTRMLTAAPDGSDLRVVDDNGLTSHFIWRDPEHILAYSRQPSHGQGFYLFEDRDGGAIDVVGGDQLKVDGHCSYLPGNEWILNDTYPDKNRNQKPHLYHVATGRVVPLGEFHSPKEYTGEWRCDTHPRFSRDGKLVVIDSPHEDQGRQMHLIDISDIVG
ncbi:MAG: hypothetical protein DWQ37_05200 [Planctomycetota bacterium]|nr:MAG: hypothetical protein DWQ37_05200 [Planctomycetota bacterium]